MKKIGQRIVSIGILFLILLPVLTTQSSCKKDASVNAVASCEGCHTNYEYLKQVYSPDTFAVAGGCGGSAPHYEPYDRVVMRGEGYEAFKASGHYQQGCTSCHGGTDNTADKEVAHSGDFIAHPSDNYQSTCKPCHQSIVEDFTTSLHKGTGQKRKVTMRSGLSGPEDFSQLPAHQQEGYSANCAICHGTCGNCHVVRPLSKGGGLADGHMFNKTPSTLNTCIGCHATRVGHAFLGTAPGTQPDVHLTKLNYECLNCHSGAEVHGNGQPVDQRYAYSELPECEDCHTGIESANIYHSTHLNTFNCQVCHSQDYNNCGSCHIHGDGARVPAYLGFKIAKNPLADIKSKYELSLVRRTLAAPDNWSVYGVDEYANFDVFPTYNYCTPHNIQRWTSRTETDGACSKNCHIRNENGTLINKGLYLMMDDLLPWEESATGPITLDGKLPSSWFN